MLKQTKPILEDLINSLHSLTLKMSRPELDQIINRIAALEACNVVPTQIDYSDPPLYFTKPDRTSVNPESFEKIPDLVKDLPIFTGDPSELNSWLSDVDSLVQLYQTKRTDTIERQNKYHMICKFIRRKIRGEANDSLVASNVGINWNLIKKTLVTYYGEKRDLETLDFQLMSVQQKNRSLEIYYDEVNRLLSLIANQINTDERFTHPEASRALIEMYNKKAIDAFMRGLDGDVYKFIRNYEPTSLAAAYSYCISFQNIECRKLLTKPRTYTPPTAPRNMIPLPPPTPIRYTNPPPPPRPHHPKPFNGYRNFNNFTPRNQQPFQQKPFNQFNQRQPPPEPMDVDQSMRTHQVNYGNCPNSNNVRPPKRPRANNIQTNAGNPNTVNHITDANLSQTFDNGNNNVSNQTDDSVQQSFERYLRTIEKQEGSNFRDTLEVAELNFLD